MSCRTEITEALNNALAARTIQGPNNADQIGLAIALRLRIAFSSATPEPRDVPVFVNNCPRKLRFIFCRMLINVASPTASSAAYYDAPNGTGAQLCGSFITSITGSVLPGDHPDNSTETIPINGSLYLHFTNGSVAGETTIEMMPED